jgi:sulfite dehydrogenase (cytochrome) subunit A
MPFGHERGFAMNRREWVYAIGAGLVPLIGGKGYSWPIRIGEFDEPFAKFPGKVPLRVVSETPACFETPWKYFRDDFTSNDAFYVRWHLRDLPAAVNPKTWRLKIDGHVENLVEVSLEQLKEFEQVTVVAVNQCSGNSRSFMSPRVPGSQWKDGALGNARWTGVRLKDLLDRAGVKAKAVEAAFDGLDKAGPSDNVPDYVKSLAIDHAREPEVLVATQMNGEPLPMLNGFPARLVVPGYYATYWVKALDRITVLDRACDSYWMTKAYLIPANHVASESPENLAKMNEPINRMNVRSFFVTPDPAARIAVGAPCALEGIAFDGGDGIKSVELSLDGGKIWRSARLGEDHGRYSFRRWKFDWTPSAKGDQSLLVRATNCSGQTQPNEPRWNKGGFMRNVIERRDFHVV